MDDEPARTFSLQVLTWLSMNALSMRMMIHPELVSTPRIRRLEICGQLRFDFRQHLNVANIHRGSLLDPVPTCFNPRARVAFLDLDLSQVLQ